MRLSAAIDRPPSSVGGIVAKPIAHAFGYRAKDLLEQRAPARSLDGPFGTLLPWRHHLARIEHVHVDVDVDPVRRSGSGDRAGRTPRASCCADHPRLSCSILDPSSSVCSSGSVKRTPPITTWRSRQRRIELRVETHALERATGGHGDRHSAERAASCRLRRVEVRMRIEPEHADLESVRAWSPER